MKWQSILNYFKDSINALPPDSRFHRLNVHRTFTHLLVGTLCHPGKTLILPLTPATSSDSALLAVDLAMMCLLGPTEPASVCSLCLSVPAFVVLLPSDEQSPTPPLQLTTDFCQLRLAVLSTAGSF